VGQLFSFVRKQVNNYRLFCSVSSVYPRKSKGSTVDRSSNSNHPPTCVRLVNSVQAQAYGKISDSGADEYVDESSEMLRRVLWYKLTDVSEVLAASIIRISLMMEAVNISETSVNSYKMQHPRTVVDILKLTAEPEGSTP
jgi:hypothetical protein